MSSHGSDRARPGEGGRLPGGGLTPRSRGAFAFILLAIFVSLLLSEGFVPTPGAAIVGAWAAAIGTLVLARTGFFAVRADVVLVGAGGPRLERHRLRPVPKRGRVEALDAPAFVAGRDADPAPRPAERVIGVRAGGGAWAYPLRILSVREAVNHALHGLPVTVTWAPFCYSGRVYEARPASGPDGSLRLTSSGRLLLNSPLLADRKSGELYVQFLGRPLGNVDDAETLPELPAVNTTWAAWSAAYPDTMLLQDRNAPESDVFEGYYMSDRAGMHRPPRRDHRWPAKEVVAGVELDGDPRGFPLLWLREQPVVTEQVGRRRVLVVLERLSATVLAYRPALGGRELSFALEPGPGNADPVPASAGTGNGGDGQRYEPLMLRDTSTGSLWHAIRGECVEGELAGNTLERLPAPLSFWFAWSSFHPGGRLMARPAVDMPGPGERRGDDVEAA